LGTKARSIGQPATRAAGTSVRKSVNRSYVDFTVVSGYLESLLLVAILIVLGIAEGFLESL
jgi:hypothetical protein